MFAADAATFLADFGSLATWSPSTGGPAVCGLVLFELPDAVIQNGGVQTREYEATFETAAWPGLAKDEQLVIDGDGRGLTYKLRGAPQSKDDGVFSLAKLTRVAP